LEQFRTDVKAECLVHLKTYGANDRPRKRGVQKNLRGWGSC
jgi:hypothetical protein